MIKLLKSIVNLFKAFFRKDKGNIDLYDKMYYVGMIARVTGKDINDPALYSLYVEQFGLNDYYLKIDSKRKNLEKEQSRKVVYKQVINQKPVKNYLNKVKKSRNFVRIRNNI